MVIQIVGKQNFHSANKNKDFYILHTLTQSEQVDGFAVDQKFVSVDLFNKVQLNKHYDIVYGAYTNGRAYISDLREVVRKSDQSNA